MCTVSVIIPVYNVEKYLPACLDSVLGQTLRDLEVICIDDRSPDRCGEILDRYAARDGRIRVIHMPENHGQGYGRNRGLERACGKYVYFLDSDDMIEPEAMEELSALADRDGLDAVFFDNTDLFEDEELKKIYTPPLPRTGTYRDGVYVGSDLLDDFIRQNEWTCYPQRTFWRRSFLLEEGILYPENVKHEDEYFAFAGILAAGRTRYVRKRYFILRTRPGSVMTGGMSAKDLHGYLMNFYYMNRFVAGRGADTFGAQKNILRMLERATTLYAGMKDGCDLGEAFAGEPDRTVFRCFLSMMRDKSCEYALDREVLDVIRRCRTVYIYGIRFTGQRFCEKLENLGDILIGGFLVKDPEGGPRVVRGRNVWGIDEVEIPEDAVVVAAVKQVFWEETRAMLEARNIRCVFHRRL